MQKTEGDARSKSGVSRQTNSISKAYSQEDRIQSSFGIEDRLASVPFSAPFIAVRSSDQRMSEYPSAYFLALFCKCMNQKGCVIVPVAPRRSHKRPD